MSWDHKQLGNQPGSSLRPNFPFVYKNSATVTTVSWDSKWVILESFAWKIWSSHPPLPPPFFFCSLALLSTLLTVPFSQYAFPDIPSFTHVRNGWQHDGRGDGNRRKLIKPRDILDTGIYSSVDRMHIKYKILDKILNGGFSETKPWCYSHCSVIVKKLNILWKKLWREGEKPNIP